MRSPAAAAWWSTSEAPASTAPTPSLRPPLPEYWFVQFGFSPSGTDLDRIGELATSGAVRASIDRVLPFADIAEAHALSETGHVTGKIVLRLPAGD